MATAKKTTAKKTATKKTSSSDPLADVRADTPSPELTDLDRANESCAYCGRDAVARRADTGAALCEKHQARAEARGREVGKL